MGLRLALIVTTADRYFGMAVNFLTLAIAARLLTPSEFGVTVIGIAITSIAVAARDFAPQAYIVQKSQLDELDIRAAFTWMMLITMPIAASIAIASHWLERVYGQPGLQLYLCLIALALTIDPFQQTIVGLLRREMAFGKVALVNALSALASSAALLFLLHLGFGFQSFGWAGLAASTTMMIISVACRPDLRVFRPTWRGWSPMLRFGSYNGIAALLYRVYEAVPFLIFPRILSFNSLGVLNRVFALVQVSDKVFLAGVMAVAMPAFSQISRDKRDLKAAYIHAIEHITALQWPALAMLAVLAGPIVAVVLGDQWTAAVPLVRIAALGWMFSFSNELNYPILVVNGAMRENLVRAAVIWPISAAILLGAGFLGATAVALSFLITIPLQAVVSMSFVRTKLSITYLEILGALRRSALVTAATVAGPLILAAALARDLQFTVPLAVAAAALSGVGWLIGLWLTTHPMWPEIVRVVARLLDAPIRRRLVPRRS